MSFIFGGMPPTTAELARRYRTAINRSVREIDREMARVAEQERSGMAEIRRFAPTNPSIALQKAQAVVRARRTQSRFALMKSQLQEIGSRIMAMRSTEALETALRSANSAMTGFNMRAESNSVLGALRDYERNSARMNVQSETMDEMLEETFDQEESAEEVDQVVQAVLDEAGVKLPAAILGGRRSTAASVAGDEDDREARDLSVEAMERRLNRLRTH